VSPQRIQRKRSKGWKMPEGAIYVGRPSRWGNPNALNGERYVVDLHGYEHYCDVGEARGVAVRLFREQLVDGHLDFTVEDVRAELAGKDLLCWCPLLDAQGKRVPCHGDVLFEVANS